MSGPIHHRVRPAKLEAARASWREIFGELRRAPVTDAAKLVEQIREDLDEAFPPARSSR